MTFLIRTFIFVALGALLLLCVSAFRKGRERDHREGCVRRMVRVSQAIRLYAADHGNEFPPSATWADAVLSRVRPEHGEPEKCFQCPAGEVDQRSHYAFNFRLAGLQLTNVPHDTVMLFETTAGGWNLSGSRGLMLSTPRHGSFTVSLADGTTMMLPASRLKELRWEP